MRRVAIVTTTRADYGLLRFVVAGLAAAPDVELQLIASGSHLVGAHGATLAEVEEDGVRVADRVDMLLAGDSPAAAGKSAGLATMGFADSFRRLEPHVVVLLGDRYEILSAAHAALVATIPIAHLHGGELSEGAFDDSLRHAITKLAHLHFVATEESARRVRQLGERPDQVFVTGAVGLDGLRRGKLPSIGAVSEFVGLDLSDGFLMVTYHPETLGNRRPSASAIEVVEGLDQVSDMPVVVTAPNADPGGQEVTDVLESWVARTPRAVFVPSMGHQRYLAALQHATAVVGNSSSGIIEAPSAGAPTVNVGGRQARRPRSTSVVDVATERGAVARGISQAMSMVKPPPRAPYPNPYDHGDASDRIVSVLRTTDLEALRRKQFVDWDENRPST